MKPDYVIVNGKDIVGRVYSKNGHKIIMMNPNVNIENGFRFLSLMNKVEDKEVEEILQDFLISKK